MPTLALATGEADLSLATVSNIGFRFLHTSSLASPTPNCTHNSGASTAAAPCSSLLPLRRLRSIPSEIVNRLKIMKNNYFQTAKPNKSCQFGERS